MTAIDSKKLEAVRQRIADALPGAEVAEAHDRLEVIYDRTASDESANAETSRRGWDGNLSLKGSILK